MIRKLYNGRQRGAKVLAGLKVSASSGGLADSMYARERECSPVFSSVLIHVCQRTRVFSSVLQCSPVFSSVLQCSPVFSSMHARERDHLHPTGRTLPIRTDSHFPRHSLSYGQHPDSTRTSLLAFPGIPSPSSHSPSALPCMGNSTILPLSGILIPANSLSGP